MADANLKKLGNNVRVLRHQKGLSQEQLAELTGLNERCPVVHALLPVLTISLTLGFIALRDG